MNPCTLQLKPGREKPILYGHPWVFSGGISAWRGRPQPGDVVDVYDAEGAWIARGLAHPDLGLPVRIYTRRQDEPLDTAFFARRIDEAVALRTPLFSDGRTNAYRLVFSEADLLSGLVVDRYGDHLAVRFSSAALAVHAPELVQLLAKATGVSSLHVGAEKEDIERERLDVRSLSRLSSFTGGTVPILQDGFAYEVDIAGGQKTGFYLDQRVNRSRIAAYAAGRRVLSCHCYSGALEVYLDRAGARDVVAIDSSGPALAQARRHAELNTVKTPIEWMEADVPIALRKFRDTARTFDLIVLDPPKFVLSEAQKEKGLRAYKDINLLAMKLLAPGGVLATFSCSGVVNREDLKMVLAWAAKDANRSVQVLETLSQPPDHPILVGVPETEYLRGFIAAIRV